MKKIMIDVDGVLADFVSGFSMLAWTLFGAPVVNTLNKPSWNKWDGLDKKQVDAVWEAIRKDDGFFTKLPPLLSAQAFAKIEEIQSTGVAEVYFVTARSVKNAKDQTERWLENHGISNPTVVITTRKGEFCKAVGINFSMEDKAENADCIAWLTDGKTQSFILDRPYNSGPFAPHSSKVLRVNSVEQYLAKVRETSNSLTMGDLKVAREILWGNRFSPFKMSPFI